MAMRGIAKRARRCPKASAGRRCGRPCASEALAAAPASPARSFLPGGPHGRSLWVMITDPWYYRWDAIAGASPATGEMGKKITMGVYLGNLVFKISVKSWRR